MLRGGEQCSSLIGFDSISTTLGGPPAVRRSAIGIIASLFLCSLLYIAVAAVIRGSRTEHRTNAAIESAFQRRRARRKNNSILKASAGLIREPGRFGPA